MFVYIQNLIFYNKYICYYIILRDYIISFGVAIIKILNRNRVSSKNAQIT